MDLADQYVNYFQNSVTATIINREYCRSVNSAYPAEVWGLTACYGPQGYRPYGAPPPLQDALSDGTICPAASIGSMVFTPVLAQAAVAAYAREFGDKLWGAYGLYESCSPPQSYFKEFYSAAQLGNLIIQVENSRSGLVWDLFAQDTYLRRALRMLGITMRR